MKCLLPLVILINCLMIQGVLEWTVVGKVTEYGQNVTLFCNVPNCCPRDAGWDRWTPRQRTLFIDVKTGRPNKKYDGKVLKDGYTLIIQNFTENDLNVSYSCLYGVTLGEIKFLLKEDVFTPITQQDVSTGLSPGEIGAIITGITMVLVLVSILIYFRTIRSKKQGIGKGKNTKKENEDVHDETKELLPNETSQTNIQEFQEIRAHNPLFETQPKPTKEHSLLQAAYIIIYTVPIAIEDFIDREYKGGFVQAVMDYKDQLKANIRTEEWNLLSQMIGNHSVRLQKNYHNSNQNLSDVSNVSDSLISKGVLEPDDTPDEIRSDQDYMFFLEALKEDPVSANAELASVLESTDVNQDELNQTSSVIL